MNANDLNEARRIKALDRLYNFDDKIMSLGAFLNSITITRKSTYTQEYASRKVNLEYKKINPKTWYTVWYMKNGQEVGIDVPKLVYDTIPEPAPTFPTVEGEGAGQYTFDVKPNQQLAMF